MARRSKKRRTHLQGEAGHALCGQPIESKQWLNGALLIVSYAPTCLQCVSKQAALRYASPPIVVQPYTIRKDGTAERTGGGRGVRGYPVAKRLEDGTLHVVWVTPKKAPPAGYERKKCS